MTNMFRKTKIAVRGGPAGVGIWAQLKSGINFGRLFVDRTGTGEASQETLATRKVITVSTATKTLTPADDGALVLITYTAGTCVVTLPSTAKNLRFGFAVQGLAGGGAGHSVSPAAADKIMGNGFTAADDKDAICSAATDRLGDYLEVEGDGNDGWIITGVIGTWAREA